MKLRKKKRKTEDDIDKNDIDDLKVEHEIKEGRNKIKNDPEHEMNRWLFINETRINKEQKERFDRGEIKHIKSACQIWREMKEEEEEEEEENEEEKENNAQEEDDESEYKYMENRNGKENGNESEEENNNEQIENRSEEIENESEEIENESEED